MIRPPNTAVADQDSPNMCNVVSSPTRQMNFASLSGIASSKERLILSDVHLIHTFTLHTTITCTYVQPDNTVR